MNYQKSRFVSKRIQLAATRLFFENSYAFLIKSDSFSTKHVRKQGILKEGWGNFWSKLKILTFIFAEIEANVC